MIDQQIGRLSSPARRVPTTLRTALLANGVAFSGALFWAIGSLLAPLFVAAGDPIGSWRLSSATLRASGELEFTEPTMFSEV